MFSIAAGLGDDLNKNNVSERLEDEFKTKGFSLSKEVNVTKKRDGKWMITDKRKRKIYIVRKEKGKLNIYGKGIRLSKEIVGEDNQVSFGDALYFSMVTFTTVGFGDWYPVGRCRVLVMIEGLVGWLTLALFLVTLANVMIRP